MKYVYCFTNLINGKKYVGSTVQLPEERRKQHYNDANTERKKNYPLYQAFKKYGKDNFLFEVLVEKECSEQEIRLIEREYIEKLNTLTPNGYNQTLNTEHSFQDPLVYKKVSETKREQSKQVAMLTLEEELVKIFRSIADCAEETGYDEKKIGACCRGERKTTQNHIFYWLDENDNYIIPEYKRDYYKGDINTTQKQITNRKVAKVDLKTDEIIEIYDSVALAGRLNDCDASGISKVCRGKRNQVKGFKWKYIDAD